VGFVPGANYGKHGAIFETVHGTAPDIAGKGIANPVAAIKTGALLLDYLGHGSAGDRIRAAVNAVLRAGTGDDAGYRRQGGYRGDDRGGDSCAQIAVSLCSRSFPHDRA